MNFKIFLFLTLWLDDIKMIKMKLFGINAIIKHIELTIQCFLFVFFFFFFFFFFVLFFFCFVFVLFFGLFFFLVL